MPVHRRIPHNQIVLQLPPDIQLNKVLVITLEVTITVRVVQSMKVVWTVHFCGETHGSCVGYTICTIFFAFWIAELASGSRAGSVGTPGRIPPLAETIRSTILGHDPRADPADISCSGA